MQICGLLNRVQGVKAQRSHNCALMAFLASKSLKPKGLPLDKRSKNSFNELLVPKIEGFAVPVE
jgi:hypothetical protein